MFGLDWVNGLNRFKMNKKIRIPLFATMLLFSAQTFAASVSVFIDQSNALADGTNYLQVTISDGADGAINFSVETLGPLSDIAGSNYGIQSFSFNLGATGATLDNIVGPDGWQVSADRNHSEFGRYDAHLAGRGSNRQDALEFSIVGVSGDTPLDYLNALSSGNASGGNQLFAAHVTGFDGPNDLTGAQFGGTTVVPLPTSAWLMLSGLGVLGWMRRKQS
jgi:hypothetical protein